MDKHDPLCGHALAAHLRRAAEVMPPPALEQRLMAAFDARQVRPSHRRWPLSMAMAASILAAVLVLHSLQAPTYDVAHPAGDGWAATSAPDEEVRRFDRSLELARARAAEGSDDTAFESALWLAREQSSRGNTLPGPGETSASHDPIAL